MSETISASDQVMVERLGRSELFGNLAADDRLAIAQLCTEEAYNEGMAILVEDEAAEMLFVVERGKLALEKKVQLGRHSTPRNATIDYIVPGKTAGFSALVSPYIYSTSAVCVEPTRVIAIEGQALREYLLENPMAGFRVMETLTALVSNRYRQATSTLTYFLSVVSHELRSPLAAIENYLRIMLGGYAGELNPKQERMVKRSILRVTDLRGQIGDVVDLARMRPEQIQTDFAWIDLEEVTAEAIEDVRLAAAEKKVEVEVIAPEMFEPIVGASRRLRQVFTNLLANAIRYSPAESQVILRCWYEPGEVCIEVADQGPGIAAEDMPNIFKDFYRAGQAKDQPGMGLGLSIAKKIVDAHHGRIEVVNLAGGGRGTGSRFTVTVPRDLKTAEMLRRTWVEWDGVLDEAAEEPQVT